ncbi:hypothetical protein N7G274_008571 [Stereocaulon virgatum]|uniref:Glycosyltransferase family 32 protein n=1 Tax=Stereocaulon virgatum TaxID=373712 RepID=A0ABR4A641_9LECA
MQSPGSKSVKSASLAFFLLSLILLLQSPIARRLPTSSISILNVNHASQSVPPIPNIVHFVHLVKLNPTGGVSHMDFQFRQFLSVYSAWYYLRPESIYIHTNVDESLIKETLRKAKSPYTQAIARLPNVSFHYHAAPNRTTDGQAIDKIPNQSDFVRTDIMQQYGGVYLDDDVYVLRDLYPLRHIGFKNIVGRQADGHVCGAVLLATPHGEKLRNEMMIAYHTLMDAIFDGGWETHSVFLLTTLVREFYADPSQVLDLPQDSFFPLSWWHDDLEYLYRRHNDTAVAVVNNKPTTKFESFIANFKLWQDETWERDWRTSYVLHGWTSAISSYLDETEQLEVFGSDQGITLDYVLEGTSNFALAVLPAVKHAVENGILNHVTNGSMALGGAVMDPEELLEMGIEKPE